ncbi:uncharacterized protein LOC114794083 [Denticeps clupeoides]|uniref:C-factor-like n=1 Tax=Denticeps clupeoides TaxID=299321 RepID=A0AAY4BQJ6_9TELE|nr:uncharacterized protein LOC114794083 [Denticeps clupeoides]
MQWDLGGCRSLLVTGASRGLGLQMVKDLVACDSGARPDTIVATARNPAAATELQKVADASPGVRVVALDVLSQESIEQAVEEVAAILGSDGLNCLINNAGIHMGLNLETVTADAMKKTFETNTVGPLLVTKAFLPQLRAAAAQGSGMGVHRAAVVNISSSLGSIQLTSEQLAEFKAYAYKTSKAALNMVTRCMAVDLESEGILCVALHPGWVRTDMGGQRAPMSVEESMTSVLSVISSLTQKDHGSFMDYLGKTVAW